MDGPFEVNVSEPWFSAIKHGKKTIEGRLRKNKFASVKPGTTMVIRNSTKSKSPAIVAVVIDVVRYDSFHEFLVQEGLSHTLPGLTSIADGVDVYREFYNEQMEKEHGVVAIHLRKLK